MHPFRFAVQLNGADDGPAWRQMVRRVEDLGYSTVFVPDHLGGQWGPFVALAVAAEATTTLNVGSLVLDNDFRHPVVMAKEAASLDLASEGRFELGIGAGWMRADYEQSGIPYDSPGTRIGRLGETLQILRALWHDGSATFHGRHYDVTAAQAAPRPHTPSGPPLIIGGGGRRVLTLAARHADIVGVNTNLRSGEIGPDAAAEALPSRFDERLRWVREAAGNRFDDLELQCWTFLVHVGGDRREVAANIGPIMGMSPDDVLDVPLALVGSVDEICDVLETRRQRWGFSYIVVHEPEIDSFAPVVARLTGK